jgi:hypothetical protein
VEPVTTYHRLIQRKIAQNRVKIPVKRTGTGTVKFYNMKFPQNKMAAFDFLGVKIRDV